MKAGRKGFCFSVCIFAHPLICLISSYRLKGRMNARKMIFTGVKWFTALIKIVYTWQQMFMCKKTGQRLALLNPYKITFGSCWVWFMLWSSYSCQYHSLLPLWSVYLPLNPYYLTACGCRVLPFNSQPPASSVQGEQRCSSENVLKLPCRSSLTAKTAADKI